MPTLTVTTKGSNSVWKSPDGQREIFEVIMDYKGQSVKAKTYSKDISTVGWSGDVESYEKQGGQGSETFVKQPQKEGGFVPNTRGGKNYASSGDQFTMFLSYAKDIAIACVNDKKIFDPDLYTAMLSAVEAGGAQLYAGRPGAADVGQTSSTNTSVPSPEPEVVVEDVDEGISQLSAVFGDVEKLSEDGAWKPGVS